MATAVNRTVESSVDLNDLRRRFLDVRRFTLQLCEPLEIEDYVVQSMPDASPVRWHLAHTTWFFETFVLGAFAADARPYREAYRHLFNSYYNAVGEAFPRPRRGLLSRPTVGEIRAYRASVDERMLRLLAEPAGSRAVELCRVVELGLQHEQQHQELILTDVKHMLSCNPLFPVYRPRPNDVPAVVAELRWLPRAEGLCAIGHEGPGFCFDNEQPRHRALVHAFELADRLVTNAEYLEFIAVGGYRRPEYWLSEGWATAQREGWQAPLHWHHREGVWQAFTLAGLRPVAPAEPVCHVSYYEADAYARWRAARLPTETEWEVSAASLDPALGNFADGGRFHPAPTGGEDAGGLRQAFGDVWEWTASPYVAYPGYRPAAGALGEYNGKFMCNQFVLRGGSCATPAGHIRASYRNFFPPAARWQFSGIRLAR